MADSSHAKGATAEDRRYMDRAEDLSDSVRRAKWIHSPDEREDREGQTLATRERAVIEAWAKERNAAPATIPGGSAGDGPRVLRFDFPGGSELEEIDWDDWFATFEERNLVFIFQQHRSDGSQSNFFRLDNPDRGDA